ncbi:hypothetical protein LEN26_007256 [Aphanomyces euteiches]|nr:hypothetical protein AeMF1_012040 [Aphanomyces euteiches]KAH9132923.1 hypothetical protein LEN26_007256 [Aphanomyces euteiches]KAH9196598.1 hypothetical protein AeNC1_001411 [Aphanomyces euteiches]
MVVLCRFVFCGAEEDEPFSVLLPSEPPPTLQLVRSYFPFEGLYHFRLQESTTNGSYVWRDLIHDSTVIPTTTSGDILLKVLQLSSTPQEKQKIYSSQVDNANEFEQFQAWFRAASADVPVDHERIPKSSSKQNLNTLWKSTKHQINKTTAKVWETVEFTAGRYFGSQTGADKPSAAALQQLAGASALSRTPFNESNREHLDYLRRMWVGIFGESRPFACPSSSWVEIGFPVDDPVGILKSASCGMLGLHALVFFGEVHRSASQEMVSQHQYNYATVGFSVMAILADILDLDSGRFLERDEVYWKLFEGPIGIFELFSVSFHAYDSFFQHAKATRAFHTPLEMTGQFVYRVLMQGPKSIEELVNIAHELRVN